MTEANSERRGPLRGIKIVELAGIGPGPVAAMFLADLGATIIRVDRKEPSGLGVEKPVQFDIGLRNRKSIRVDLKDPKGLALVLDLIAGADALIEGFRPGVMERLGLGPDVCLKRNAKLVYGRATGWGQDGPLAHSAGHDVNYVAITGILNAIGRAGDPPTIPLNIMGDYAGGALFLAFGMLAGIIEARNSGLGQVVDGAMVDGAAALTAPLLSLRASGILSDERGTNLIDSGASFYDVYECADGKYISIAPIEAKFYRLLLDKLELKDPVFDRQMDKSAWPEQRRLFAAKFITRTRAEWTALLEGTDACFSPVLSFAEAPSHPHLAARKTFVEVDGLSQPAPGPRFSRTPPDMPTPPAPLTTDNAQAALAPWLNESAIAAHRAAGTFI
ncbi:CaiB/BaiF CoA transferase family protein [Ramlibacter sp.]|uniref:CaiB/BaiF CoA transferase family protein n=1 Tax=Ramlibacter sp. TaxID=1917967 RepID=UPI003D12E525